MAKKKSFTIGSSLTQALTDTVTAAKNYAGDLNIEVIPLRKVELDAENPRDLLLEFKDLYQGIASDDEAYARKHQEKESLQSLSFSIQQQGIINPIVVYKFQENYRLVAGERRTLASILAGKEDIPAKILASKPDALKLSLLQWAENIEREDLSLSERLCNLEKITKAYAKHQQVAIDAISSTDLSKLIGCSLQQAINYRSILFAPETLRLSIQKQQIKNIEKAALIAKSPAQLQPQLIELCISGSSLKKLKSVVAASAVKQKGAAKEKRGRQSSKISFGSTTKVGVAKAIITSVLKNDELSHLHHQLSAVEWNDYREVSNAFKSLITILEKTI